MKHRSRFRRSISLGLVLGALATPAQAGTRPDDRAFPLGVGTPAVAADSSDVVSRYLRNHPKGARPGDRAGSLAVEAASLPTPDVFERYVAAHPYGTGLSAARTVSQTSSGRFHWGDYGAGVGTGITVVLLLAGGLVAMPVRRRRTQTV